MLRLGILLGLFGLVFSLEIFAHTANDCVGECLEEASAVGLRDDDGGDDRDDDDENDRSSDRGEENDDDEHENDRDNDDDRSYLESANITPLISNASTTDEVSLQVGGNIIGFSVQMNMGDIYTSCPNVRSLHTFDARSQQWVIGLSDASVESGQGAYIYSDEDCRFVLSEVASQNASLLVRVSLGWNLVGTSIAVDNFKSWDSSCVQSVYANYQNTPKSYHLDSQSGALRLISAHEGFFVLAKKDCTIDLANSSFIDSSVPALPSVPTTTNTQTTQTITQNNSSFDAQVYYSQNCASCHSKTDRDIKGKSYSKLLSELKVYQQNRGEVRKMNEVLSPVSNIDLESLAQYLASF